MRNLSAKLKSQSGASVLIALVFFLLCLTVGAVVLTAATASTGRLTHMRQDQQDYLTVSSAARLLREALSGETFRETIVTVTAHGSSHSTTSHDSPGGALAETVEADAISLCRGAPAAPRSFTVSVDGLDEVSAVLRMGDDFTLTVAFSLDGGRCPMLLTVPAAEDHPEPAVHSEEISYWTGYYDENGDEIWDFYTKTTETDVRTVVWGEGIITKGGGAP